LAIPNYTYLKLKMPGPKGVITFSSSYEHVYECDVECVKYWQAVESSTELASKLEALAAEAAEPKCHAGSFEPAEGTKKIPLDPNNSDGMVLTISADLDPKYEAVLIDFLCANTDMFAWSPSDMPGIPREVAEHSLEIRAGSKPVKQRLCRFDEEKHKIIGEEIHKLLTAGFIKEVHHPDWLSNPILVKKKNGKMRMCVDYTSLNKACLKVPFPLPCIDQIVDSTAGSETPSFLDAYSGYHQIKMKESDQLATSFIMPFGMYCYVTMPFGLRNARATYQRCMLHVFGKHIGSTVEAYVDDIVVKSKQRGDLIQDLKIAFSCLRANKIKLNPEKCVFGVPRGMLLGYIVAQHGIEANPEKVLAITRLGPI